MDALRERQELDTLVRRVQQATKDWPSRPAPLAQALAAAEVANDVGIDVGPALAGLRAAWEREGSPPAVEEQPEA